MRQLMCTAVSQLRSDQLVPLHHHAHFMYPACLFFLIYMLFVTLLVGCSEATGGGLWPRLVLIHLGTMISAAYFVSCAAE
jgi:hypothetical protein